MVSLWLPARSEAATDWLTFWEGSAWWLLPLASSCAVGLLLAMRRPRNALGWVFLAFGTIGTLGYGCFHYAMASIGSGATDPGFGVLAALWFAWSTPMLAMSLASVFPLLLFPEGLQSPRWRPVLWLAAGNTALMTGLAVVAPTLELPGSAAVAVDNPFGPSWLPTWFRPYDTAVATTAMLVFQVTVIVAGVGVVLRFRRSAGIERLQLRWFMFAAAMATVAAVLGTTLENSDSMLVVAILPLTLAFLPVACGIAILRYRLYDIDRIIGRTTAYGLVTGVLLAVYAAVVTAMTVLLPGVGDAATAAATLAAAAAFRPVLRWAQRVVDRRFNRSRFDAAQEVDAFAARLRASLDADATAADLRGVVSRTLEPAAMGIWTMSSERGRDR